MGGEVRIGLGRRGRKEGDGRSFFALCCGLKLVVWDPSVVLRG